MSDEHTTKTGFFRPLQIMTEVAAVPLFLLACKSSAPLND